jgi:hypothetical protein
VIEKEERKKKRRENKIERHKRWKRENEEQRTCSCFHTDDTESKRTTILTFSTERLIVLVQWVGARYRDGQTLDLVGDKV